jgi:hypothetical protein
MKTQKIKRYRLGVIRTFPKGHPRAVEDTGFIKAILKALNCPDCTPPDIEDYCNGCRTRKKLHTIRSNYPLWDKRMKEVKEGRAVIELFYWSGKPYNSPQIVFATLDKDSGCGLQKLNFVSSSIKGIDIPIIDLVKRTVNPTALSKNDGLSLEDFKAWFKGYDLSKQMAIIHFTKFRY